MPVVCVTASHFHFPEQEYYGLFKNAGFDVRFVDPDKHNLTDPGTLLEVLGDSEAVLCSTEPYSPEVLSKCKLRVVSRAGVGFDSVDLEAATANGIVVTRTPGVLHQSAAEQTLALILAIYRNVVRRDREVREGKWDRTCWPRLAGQMLGLIGLGPIGRSVADKANAFGLKVIAYDPFAAPHEGVELVTLDQIWPNADIVSLHVPCNPETVNLINPITLQRMKPGAVLINTSRGGLVDEKALAESLRSRHLRAAGIDVFHEEPPLPDNPLLKLDNVILSPHMAGMDLESEREMASMAAQNIIDLYRGRWPSANVVNEDVRPNWKW